jgi:hypothetical protein
VYSGQKRQLSLNAKVFLVELRGIGEQRLLIIPSFFSCSGLLFHSPPFVSRYRRGTQDKGTREITQWSPQTETQSKKKGNICKPSRKSCAVYAERFSIRRMRHPSTRAHKQNERPAGEKDMRFIRNQCLFHEVLSSSSSLLISPRRVKHTHYFCGIPNQFDGWKGRFLFLLLFKRLYLPVELMPTTNESRIIYERAAPLSLQGRMEPSSVFVEPIDICSLMLSERRHVVGWSVLAGLMDPVVPLWRKKKKHWKIEIFNHSIAAGEQERNAVPLDDEWMSLFLPLSHFLIEYLSKLEISAITRFIFKGCTERTGVSNSFGTLNLLPLLL